ncbi:MAG: hypothetical protein V4622_00745 [Bacteroidota bacterium]
MSSKINSFLLVSVILISSCSSNEKKDGDAVAKVDATLDNTYNSEKFDFVLPQPISLAKAFQASGLTYNAGLANPASNKTRYNTKVKQLLNLGVYSTDLAYCAINEQAQQAREYLNAVQELGNAVGLKPVFSDKKLVEKFDKSLNNTEAVEDLIYDIQESSEAYMDDNDIRYLAIIQFAGSWTEGMYLGIKDLETKQNENLSVTLIDQINLLENIIEGIKTYPTSDQTLTSVTNKLKDILKTYNSLESVKLAAKSSTFAFPKLTKTEISTLSSKVIDLRNYIIQ